MAMTSSATTILDVLTDMWNEAKYTGCSKNRTLVVNSWTVWTPCVKDEQTGTFAKNIWCVLDSASSW